MPWARPMRVPGACGAGSAEGEPRTHHHAVPGGAEGRAVRLGAAEGHRGRRQPRSCRMVCERNVVDDLDAVEEQARTLGAHHPGSGGAVRPGPAAGTGAGAVLRQACRHLPRARRRRPSCGSSPGRANGTAACASALAGCNLALGRASKCLLARKAASRTRRSTWPGVMACSR